jgi:hypothetical protein
MRSKRLWIAGLVALCGLAWAVSRSGSDGDNAPAATSPRRTDVSAAAAQVSRAAKGQVASRHDQTVPATSVPVAPPASEGKLAELSPLRQPIIRAIREAGISPADKRASMLKAIEASGASHERWTEDAHSAFESWRAALPGDAQRSLRMGEVSCFRAGCVAELVFANPAAYQTAAAAFRTLADSSRAHGGRVQTPPETVSGKVVANWIMLRPELAPRDEDDDA